MSYDWKQLLAIAESEVALTLTALPVNLQAQVRQLPVTYQGRPGRELRQDGIEADTLGLFIGDSYVEQEQASAPLPPQILLFLVNLWEFAEGDETAYRRELRTTLVHELGHYLGLDEVDLEARGLE